MDLCQILIVCLTLVFSSIAFEEAELLSFSGRNLPPMDPFGGEADAYIIVYYKPSSDLPYTSYGQTGVLANDPDPDWRKEFDIPNNGDRSQMLKIEMYDSDWPGTDDYMGHVELPLYELIQSREGILRKDLIGGNPGGGSLIIRRH